MAFSEIEAQRARNLAGGFVERNRPPAHVRPQVDLAFRITGQSVELFEVRPAWRGGAGEMLELPFAKATFVRASQSWKVFWRRADMKWHAYPPAPQVPSLERFLALVTEDKHHCFRG
jgi:hypothetical protein